MKAATAWCHLMVWMLGRMVGWVRDAGREASPASQPPLHPPGPSYSPPSSKIQLLHVLWWDISSSAGFQASCLGVSSGLTVSRHGSPRLLHLCCEILRSADAEAQRARRLESQPRPSQSHEIGWSCPLFDCSWQLGGRKLRGQPGT